MKAYFQPNFHICFCYVSISEHLKLQVHSLCSHLLLWRQMYPFTLMIFFTQNIQYPYQKITLQSPDQSQTSASCAQTGVQRHFSLGVTALMHQDNSLHGNHKCHKHKYLLEKASSSEM